MCLSAIVVSTDVITSFVIHLSSARKILLGRCSGIELPSDAFLFGGLTFWVAILRLSPTEALVDTLSVRCVTDAFR